MASQSALIYSELDAIEVFFFTFYVFFFSLHLAGTAFKHTVKFPFIHVFTSLVWQILKMLILMYLIVSQHTYANTHTHTLDDGGLYAGAGGHEPEWSNENPGRWTEVRRETNSFLSFSNVINASCVSIAVFFRKIKAIFSEFFSKCLSVSITSFFFKYFVFVPF